MMKLGRLCQGLIPIAKNTEFDVLVKGLVYDSRDVKPGDLFFAVTGFQTDGHQYLDQAVQKGAAALIVEREVNVKNVPVLQVENTRSAMAFLANRFYQEPAENLLIIGITGTNGKTTVAYLLESILSEAGIEPALLGTVVYRWKGHEKTAERTTPEALDIFRYFREICDEGAKGVVMEVSSHALALDRVVSIPFDAAVFTNLSRDHLDFHHTFKAYGESKARLFSLLRKGGVGVIHGDDSASKLMIQAANERTVTYGVEQPVDYRIDQVKPIGKRIQFSILIGRDRFIFSTGLWGWFNVLNVAASSIVGLELGLDARTIQKGLDRVNRVPGRMDGLESNDGFRVVIDYAHTPDALKNVLISAREFTKERLIVVFGCGGDRDRGKRPQMGKFACELADLVYVTSDNPRTENPEDILQDILKGLSRKKNVKRVVNRREAIHRALDTAKRGDTIVVAGKGHENYQEINGRRFPFDDRSVVEQYLLSLGKL